MATVHVLNPRTSPVVIDEEGHLLEGGARGDVEDTQRNQHAVLIGALRVVAALPPTTAAAAPVAAPMAGEA